MPVVKLVSGIQVIYDSTVDGATDKNIITGSGSVLTIVVTGTSGQTASVKGSLDNQNWIDIGTFTLDVGQTMLYASGQYAYPYLQVTGDATVKIARSNL